LPAESHAFLRLLLAAYSLLTLMSSSLDSASPLKTLSSGSAAKDCPS
jgi:hypothetical protein